MVNKTVLSSIPNVNNTESISMWYTMGSMILQIGLIEALGCV